MRGKNSFNLYLILVFLILFVTIVGAIIIVGYDVNYYSNEDIVYYHYFVNNFTNNVSQLTFAFETDEADIFWNGTTNQVITNPNTLYWINLTSYGLLTINSTRDNESGLFQLPIQGSDSGGGSYAIFKFIINATNDIPVFTSIQNNYSYPTNSSITYYFINLSDEEQHYPLNFSIDFFNNCTHASWVGRLDGENCSLFNVVNDTVSTAYFNYTTTEMDIGSYWAQLTVTEAPHICPHAYCNNATYEIEHVLKYNISFDILSRLQINASNCSGMQFIEGVPKNCTIQVRTQRQDDFFNISSIASFTNYLSNPNNLSWFLNTQQKQATDFTYNFNVTVNASHSLVGYWEINLTAIKEDTSEFNWSSFSIFVNWTGNNPVSLYNFNDWYNVSVDNTLEISFNTTDPDFAIEDKYFWDEDSSINVTIINSTSGMTVSSLDYSVEKSGVSGTTLPITITFSPDTNDNGNYTVFLNATDMAGVMVYDIFDVVVIRNEYPYWNQTTYSFNFTVNSTVSTTYTNLTNLNLSRSYANDSNIEDTLSFAVSGNSPPSLSLTSQGILNFFPWKSDVGYWEFNIIVSDNLGLTNSSTWRFNVSNINSPPKIENTSLSINGRSIYLDNFYAIVNQSEMSNFSLNMVYDNDLLISNSQILNGYYDEVLTVTANITNTSYVYTPINLSFYLDYSLNNQTRFKANVTPNSNNPGNYTINLYVTDASGKNDTVRFNLTILEINSAPYVTSIGSLYTSILNRSFFYNVNATDEEDDRDRIHLNYSLRNLTIGAPNLSINSTNGSVTFDFNNNQTYSGFWQYRIIVNDSDHDSTNVDFNLTVFGLPNITLPNTNYIFNFSENSTSLFNFTIDYTINSTNLSYSIYLNNVSCYWINQTENNKSCNYTDLSLIKSGFFNGEVNSNLSINLTLGFSDETYGNYKNLSLLVYNPNYPLLNSSMNYSINISHTNSKLELQYQIPSLSTYKSTNYDLDLSNYFYDLDYSDEFYEQTVNFSLNQSSVSSSSNTVIPSYSFNEWILTLSSTSAGYANISIIGFELNDSGIEINNVSSNWFIVTFSEPPTSTVTVPTSGSSSTRIVVEHYSLKIIVPNDVEVTPDQYIKLNFSLVNDGDVDLSGIDLSSYIDLGGIPADDVTINLSESYLDYLAVGEKKDYLLTAKINAEAFGDYKITIFGNVTSPKMSDWADFYIKVLSLDEGKITELLVFTEKLVSENPECIELREIYNEAKKSYDLGDLVKAKEFAEKAIQACEDAISANEQITIFNHPLNLSLFYSIIITIFLFLAGFIYYFYRRIKFNKLDNKDYI